MATPVQTATYDSTSDGTSHSVTFGTTPITGNLIVVVANTPTGLPTPSGYTKAVGLISNTDCSLFYKIAGASEFTTVNFTIGAALSMNIAAFEYGSADPTPLDQTASADSGASSTSLVNGTTAATTQASEIAIAAFGISSGGAPAVISYSDSFAEISQGVTSGSASVNVRLAVAAKTLSATGTQTTTATIGSASSYASCIIATFKLTSGGAGVATRSAYYLGQLQS